MLQLNIFTDPATLPSRSYTHLPLQLGRARRFQRLVATRCAHNYWEDTPPPPSRCGAAKLIARRCKTLRETMATALSACASVRLAKYAFCTSGYITAMSGGTNLHSHSPLYTFIHNFLVFGQADYHARSLEAQDLRELGDRIHALSTCIPSVGIALSSEQLGAHLM